MPDHYAGIWKPSGPWQASLTPDIAEELAGHVDVGHTCSSHHNLVLQAPDQGELLTQLPVRM